MSEVFAICPHCQKRLKLRDPAMFGRKTRCPGCSQPFVLTPSGGDNADDDPSNWFEEPAEDEDDFEEELAPPVAKPKKSKSKSSEGKKKKTKRPAGEPGEYSLPVHYLMMAGTGFVGGLIGAVLWCGVVLVLPISFTYGALLVGALVGGGVRMGASKYDYGWGPAITALIVAIFAITLGEVMAVNLELRMYQSEIDEEMAIYNSEEGQILLLAQEEYARQVESGEFSEQEMEAFTEELQNKMPEFDEDDFDDEGMSLEFMTMSIPPKILEASRQKYASLTDAEKKELEQQANFEFEGVGLSDAPSILTLFDLAFFILAGGVAFSIAAGWDLFE